MDKPVLWFDRHSVAQNEKFWFGVSNPVFDFIFGTLKDGKDVELSETARNLEKEKKTKVVR